MPGAVRPILCALLVASACDPKPAGSPVEAKAEAKAEIKAATPAQPGEPMRLTPPLPSAAMVEQMLAQRVLDHPRVTPYLHTEVPANVPLRVAPSPDLAQGAAKLRVAGQVVQVVAAGEARFIFTGRERIGPARERVRFEIPAEGVTGHVDLELADNVWSAIDAALTER
jgi:hypothetical protein